MKDFLMQAVIVLTMTGLCSAGNNGQTQFKLLTATGNTLETADATATSSQADKLFSEGPDSGASKILISNDLDGTISGAILAGIKVSTPKINSFSPAAVIIFTVKDGVPFVKIRTTGYYKEFPLKDAKAVYAEMVSLIVNDPKTTETTEDIGQLVDAALDCAKELNDTQNAPPHDTQTDGVTFGV